MEKELSQLRCSEPSQGWNIVNEDLLLPALIVGSFTNVPHGQAPVCGLLGNIKIKVSLEPPTFSHPRHLLFWTLDYHPAISNFSAGSLAIQNSLSLPLIDI